MDLPAATLNDQAETSLSSRNLHWFLQVIKSAPLALASELSQHRALFPLAIAQMTLLADQPLLSTNMSAVANEFGFAGAEKDEKLGGIVSVVFFACGVVSSLIVGRLADVMKRSTLVCLCMLIGSTGTFSNSQAGSFTSLLFGRAAVGTAVGGLIPTSFAVIGDMCPAEERPHAIGMVCIISGLGLPVGQSLAGFAGSAAGWRAPFAVVGIAGWCVTLLLFFIHQEPDRSKDQQLSHDLSSWSALTKPTVLCICSQGVFGCIPWAVIGTFLTDYLAVNDGMGVAGATSVLFCMGVGFIIGTIAGGKLGQHLYKKDKKLQAWLTGLTMWGGMLPLFILFSTDRPDCPFMFHILALVGVFLAAFSPVNLKAVLLNSVATQSRGTVFGVYNIMDDLGKGLGPALVASWVRHLGRRNSFMLGMAFWLPSGLICLLMARTIPHDDLVEGEEQLSILNPAEVQKPAIEI